MKFFTKNELIGVTAILAIVVLLSLYNFRIALRRSRDAQRRSDLGQISNALEKYQTDFGFFPLNTENGEIKACRPEDFDELVKELASKREFDTGKYLNALAPCAWGRDPLKDLADERFSAYLETIPKDPRQDLGNAYFYLSNANRFQIYAYLEGEAAEIGYNEGIIARNLVCGENICNYGKSFGETPLDKSIEEYENELRENMNKQSLVLCTKES